MKMTRTGALVELRDRWNWGDDLGFTEAVRERVYDTFGEEVAELLDYMNNPGETDDNLPSLDTSVDDCIMKAVALGIVDSVAGYPIEFLGQAGIEVTNYTEYSFNHKFIRKYSSIIRRERNFLVDGLLELEY